MLAVIFDMFDFNDIQSISTTDYEYMLCCCANGVKKIFKTKEAVPEDEINTMISVTFPSDIRIILNQVLKFCITNNEIKEIIQFFHFQGFDQLIKEMQAQKSLSIAYNACHVSISNSIAPYIYDYPSSIAHKKSFISFCKWLAMVYSPISVKREPMLCNPEKGKLAEYGVELDWVYGINCNHKINAIEYYVSANHNYSYIIYFTGCVAILYDPINSVQKYYNHHHV